MAERLAGHQEPQWRSRAAGDPHLPADLARRPVGDDEPIVRVCASTHPALTEQERSALEADLDPDFRHLPSG